MSEQSGFRGFLKRHTPALADRFEQAEKKVDEMVHDPFIQSQIQTAKARVDEVVVDAREAFTTAREQAPGMIEEAGDTLKETSENVRTQVTDRFREWKRKL